MGILRHETMLSIPKQYLPILQESAKVGLLLLLSIWLRLQFITRDTFIDEAFSYFYSKKDILFIISGNDTHPPLYYLLLKPFSHWLGNDIIALRMTSIAIWILFAIALYSFVKQRFSRNTALYALIFATLSPTLIYYSTELRMYILLLFFLMLNLIAYFNLLDKPNAKTATIYTATCLLMLYTHLFAALPLLIEALWGLRRKSALKWLIFGLGASFILFLPQIYVTLHTYATHPIFHYKSPTIISLISTYSYMFTPPSYAIVFFALLIIFLVYFCTQYQIQPEISKYSFFYAFLLLPIPIFILAKWTGIYHHRLFLIMLPPIYIMLAHFADRIMQKSGNNADQTLFIGLFILSVFITFSFAQSIFHYENHYNFKELQMTTEPIVHIYPMSYLAYKMHFENTQRSNLLLAEPDFTFCDSVIDKNDLITDFPAKPYIIIDYTYQDGELRKPFLDTSNVLYRLADSNWTLCYPNTSISMNVSDYIIINGQKVEVAGHVLIV